MESEVRQRPLQYEAKKSLIAPPTTKKTGGVNR